MLRDRIARANVPAAALPELRVSHGLLAALAAAVLLLMLPLFDAPPSALTSDESLYLSEAYNIAQGEGPTYPTGEYVSHRAPLYPALLALPMKLAGGDPEAAYFLPKLIVVALVAATFLVARQAFGTLAGVIGALLVATSSFFRWLGTTLLLDGTETLFLLLMLAALLEAFRSRSTGWFAAAGLAFAAAFLTKESAVLWLPLPVAFALLSPAHRERRVAIGLAAYAAIAAAALASWWAWVYIVTGRVYFWGPPDARLAVALATAAVVAGAAIALWAALARLRPEALARAGQYAGVALVAGWTLGIWLFMEHAGSWPYPMDHWRTVPRYALEIAAPNSQPWPLLALGLGWTAWRWRADDASRLLALAFVLFVPFALLVANRELSYRSLLPMTYVAYIAAAGASVPALAWAARRSGFLAVAGAFLALAVLGVVQTRELRDDRLPYDHAAVTQSNWDNPLVHDTARWVDANVPAGAAVMSSRLYYSHLYVLDGGAHAVHQLPTVRIGPSADGLRAVSTQFRWEDHRLVEHDGDPRWLYVDRYPEKGYYIALSETDLLREIEERDIAYVVITGEDAGFSSLAYLDYFSANPAFELVRSDARDERNAVYVFRVRHDRLAPVTYRAAVDASTVRALAQDLGLAEEAVAPLIDPDGIETR